MFIASTSRSLDRADVRESAGCARIEPKGSNPAQLNPTNPAQPNQPHSFLMNAKLQNRIRQLYEPLPERAAAGAPESAPAPEAAETAAAPEVAAAASQVALSVRQRLAQAEAEVARLTVLLAADEGA